MNRAVTIHPGLALCDKVTQRAYDRNGAYVLRCVLPPEHRGPCLSEWRDA